MMMHHTWDDMFNRLRLNGEKHRGSPTFVEPANDPDLATWIKDQRRQYRLLKENGQESQESLRNTSSCQTSSESLDQARVRALEQIGFTWDMRHDIEWKKLFAELCQYKESYGTCMVPARSTNYQKLGHWVMTQRRQYVLLSKEDRSSRMTAERLKLLNSIGFVWVVRKKNEKSESFLNCMKEFKQFKTQHGHCNVPQNYSENTKLAQWARHLRSQYKRKNQGKHFTTLTAEIIKFLDDIGFVWDMDPARKSKAHGTRASAPSHVQQRNDEPSDLLCLSAIASTRSVNSETVAENQESSMRMHPNLSQNSLFFCGSGQRLGLHSHSYVNQPYALNGYRGLIRTSVSAPTTHITPTTWRVSAFATSPIQLNTRASCALPTW
jgi:hypothetical protein